MMYTRLTVKISSSRSLRTSLISAIKTAIKDFLVQRLIARVSKYQQLLHFDSSRLSWPVAKVSPNLVAAKTANHLFDRQPGTSAEDS